MIIKAMYFRFIVLLIVAQTRVYTNTDHFLSIFLLFIYCKRAGWKYSPTDGNVGAGFKDEGRRTAGDVVEVTQAQEEWDRTGLGLVSKWLISKRGADKERLCPAVQNMDR